MKFKGKPHCTLLLLLQIDKKIVEKQALITKRYFRFRSAEGSFVAFLFSEISIEIAQANIKIHSLLSKNIERLNLT